MADNIDVTIRFQVTGAEGAKAAINSVKTSLGDTVTKMRTDTTETQGIMGRMVGGVKGYLNDMVAHFKWASMLIGGAMVAGATNAIVAAGEFQKLSVAGEYLLGSASAADKFTESIRKMGIESMFSVEQIADLGKRLVGNTKDVKQSETALRAMMDAVAATGGGFSELEGVTRAWIQTNSKGKASAEEMNRQFANANIPVLRVLAESIVKDADHPLRKYIETATTGTGVNKTLTKSYQTASEKLPILQKTLEKTQAGLKAYNEGSKKSAESTLTHELAVMRAQTALDKANGSIATYTSAQGKAAVATKKTTLSVTDVLKQLQNIGELDIPGSIAAEAITKALQEAYGGANQAVMKSFAGQMEEVKDRVKMAVLTFVGLDEHFRIIKGSIMDLIVGGLQKLNDFLKNNADLIEDWGKKLANSKPFLLGLATFFMGVLYPAFVGLVLPLIVLGTAFWSVGFAIGKIIEHTGGFQAWGKAIKSALDSASTALTTAINKFKIFVDFIVKNKDVIIGATVGMAVAMEIAAQRMGFSFVKIIAGAVATKLSMITSFIAMAASAMASALTFAAAFLIAFGPWLLLGALIGVLVVLIIKNWDTIVAVVSAAVDKLVVFFTQTLPEAFNQLWVNITTFISNVVTWFTELPGKIITLIFNMILGMIYWIAFFIGWAIVAVPKFLSDFITWFIQAGVNLINEVLTWPGRFMTWIFKLIADVTTSVLKLIDDFIGWLTAWGIGIINEVKTWPTRFMEWLEKIPGKVAKWLVELKQSFFEGLDNIWKVITKWKDNIIGAFEAVIGIISKALDLAGKAANKGFQAGMTAANRQHGGFVPGPIGTAVPIMAHAGERVVPRSGADVNAGGGGGTGVTINITGNFSLDTEARVQQLADKIGRILGRQNELARYGAGY